MKDETISKTLEAEKSVLSSKLARYIYDQREKARRDWFSSIATAEERGKEKGFKIGIAIAIEERRAEAIEKGIAEAIEKIAINLLRLDVEVDQIQKATGLSLADLERLRTRL